MRLIHRSGQGSSGRGHLMLDKVRPWRVQLPSSMTHCGRKKNCLVPLVMVLSAEHHRRIPDAVESLLTTRPLRNFSSIAHAQHCSGSDISGSENPTLAALSQRPEDSKSPAARVSCPLPGQGHTTGTHSRSANQTDDVCDVTKRHIVVGGAGGGVP